MAGEWLLAARVVVDSGLEDEVAALARRPAVINAGLVPGQPDWPLQAAVVSGDGLGTLKGVPPPPHEAAVHGVIFGAEPADVAALLLDGAGLTVRGVPERLPLQHAPHLIDGHAWRAVIEPPSAKPVRTIEQLDDSGRVLAVAELATRVLAHAEAAVTALPPPGVRMAALAAARQQAQKGRRVVATGAGGSYAGVAAGTSGAMPAALRQPGPSTEPRPPMPSPLASTSAAAARAPVDGPSATATPAAQTAAPALVQSHPRAKRAPPTPMAAEEMPPSARSRPAVDVDLPPSARAARRSSTPPTTTARPRSRSPRAVDRDAISGAAAAGSSAPLSPDRGAPEAADGAGWRVAGRHGRHTPMDGLVATAADGQMPDASAHA